MVSAFHSVSAVLPGAFCCVFGQDTELSQASLYLGIEMGTGEYITGGNPAMDWHPVQKGGGWGVGVGALRLMWVKAIGLV